MLEVADQTGFTIRLEKIPERIVSLVPSQTELLADLQLDDRVVGITKFCVHPETWYRNKIRVGGTKTLNLDIIRQISPDLIIANKEENSKEEIEELQREYKVYTSDIYSMHDALKMITDLGVLTSTSVKAEQMIHQISKDLQNWPRFNKKVLYFMWNNPYMVAGRNTFIGEVLQLSGLDNCFMEPEGRYREIELEEIKSSGAEIIMLSSEPYPFKQEQADELEAQTGIKVLLVDGEMFSWYGSRLLKLKNYLLELKKRMN